jgi:hypothetical protein
MQIIAERKQYHESTGGQYLNFENDVETDEMIGGAIYYVEYISTLYK